MFKKNKININIYRKEDRLLIKETTKNLYKILNGVSKELNLKTKLVVSLNLVSKLKMWELNKQFRQVDKTTDVLSFAQNDQLKDEYDLGDIFVNADLLKSQADEINSDINTELCFLFMHGLLHLIGYDHLTDDQERKMFNRQREIFKNLGIRND